MDKLFSFFKTFYRKYPVVLVLMVSVLLTLPWIGVSDFYTKGEPREATVATCMLNTGNWILPTDYADEVAYKPPFMHWFIAAFSLPQGYVSEATARLPSALGLIGITLMVFVFLYKRKTPVRALMATLIMLTSFEMHRSGLEARVDMFLAFFMIASLIALFKWEEKGLSGYPVLIPVFLAGAALVKGPVGIVLPCFVFGVYLLLLRGHSLWRIIWKNLIVALPALAVLLVWYYLAYQQGGKHFLDVVYAENFGRFLGQNRETLGISYELGHKGPFWYYIPAVLLGFFPWSLLAIFAVVVLPYKSLLKNKLDASATFRKMISLDKVTLYSIVSVVIILAFYSIPSSKRSVYIMPLYPFAAWLLTLLYEWAVDYRPKLIRCLAGFVFSLVGLLLAVALVFHFVDLTPIASLVVHHAKTLHDIGLFADAFRHPGVLGVLLWLLLLCAFVVGWATFKSRAAKSLFFVALAVFITLQVFLEGFAYPVFKNGYSMRPFAEKIQSKYHFDGNAYVMNNLREYYNMYELNFYLGNQFKNFEKELPCNGYFISGSRYIDKIRAKYAGQYEFVELDKTANNFNDFRDVIIVYKIVRLGAN